MTGHGLDPALPAWARPAAPAVAYIFAPSRGKKEIATQLADFAGILQVDAYAAYKAVKKDARISGKIELAFCLAHARRKFVAVFKTAKSPFAKEVIEKIAGVYGIDAKIRGNGSQAAAGLPPVQDAACDGSFESPVTGGEGRSLAAIASDGGDRLYAQPLGWFDPVCG